MRVSLLYINILTTKSVGGNTTKVAKTMDPKTVFTTVFVVVLASIILANFRYLW